MDPLELIVRVNSFLPFTPFRLQEDLITALSYYICRHEENEIFLLNGYAGSGKTSIMGAFIKALTQMKVKTVTLAPTGRAAKVAADFSDGKASTIHRRIFRPESSEPGARFVLAQNFDKNSVFIIDEASLITDSDYPAQSLLFQLLQYIRSNSGNAIIFVGDIAQLPPVGMTFAPAMRKVRYERLGLTPISFNLDLPMRQGEGSGVLYNATLIRQHLFGKRPGVIPSIYTKGFPDVAIVSSADLTDRLSDSWNEVGVDETILITRSNIRANRYNHAIRNLVMMAEEPLQPGDRLVISRNDYFWSRINKMKNLLANGEMVEVTWVGRTEKMYGRYFTDVELRLTSSDTRIGAKLMLRSLMADGPAVPKAEMDRFYTHVLAEQEGELSERIKAAEEDPYYNALHAKYGYCVTCHKAQGGQWTHVYIDMAGIDTSALDENFYRWLYTAITRATEKVFFINPTLPVS